MVSGSSIGQRSSARPMIHEQKSHDEGHEKRSSVWAMMTSILFRMGEIQKSRAMSDVRVRLRNISSQMVSLDAKPITSTTC